MLVEIIGENKTQEHICSVKFDDKTMSNVLDTSDYIGILDENNPVIFTSCADWWAAKDKRIVVKG